MTYYIVGLDLGQSNDFTAAAYIEWQPPIDGQRIYNVVRVERYELGTPYPKIVEDVAMKMRELKTAQLVIDATGVGAPVTDMFAEKGLRPANVTITGGHDVTSDGRDYRVPKRDLISVAKVLLQTNRLRFTADSPDVDNLVTELLNFKVKISVSGHDSYDSWRESIHDDLVLALSLAAWFAETQSIIRLPIIAGTGVKGWINRTI